MDKPSTPLPSTEFLTGLFQAVSPTAPPRGRPGHWAPWGGKAADPPAPPAPEARLASVLWQQAVHDIRGKLGVVTNLTALLQRPATEQHHAALLAMLDRNVASLGRLLDGVADLARLDAAPELPVLQRVNAAAVLQRVCDGVTALAESRGLGVEFRGPAVLLAETDPLMLERIAQNLMLNAVRYTRATGVVLSCASSDGAALGRWCFEVHDAASAAGGGALPRSSLVLQLPPGGQPLPAGEGIGLSIVARLSQALGGAVQTSCTVNGRVTRISLPRRPNAAQDALVRCPASPALHPRPIVAAARTHA